MVAAGAWIVAAFLILMGLVALIAPRRVPRVFGGDAETPALRNEVRAVYGGFGLALGALVAWSLGQGALGQGVRLATAVSLLGMAGGRVVSLLAERHTGGRWPWVFFAVEVGLALLLLVPRA